ncbi:MAG TPA: cytochrome c peroxidase [Steroidobacteraceae bacterium]|nr:cytochrome c peroxidase [Steroidobacteraceae bacterium]
MSDRQRAGAAGLRLGALLLAVAGILAQVPCAAGPAAKRTAQALRLAQGFNPHPMQLREPPSRPLSAVAQLGAKLFRDERLSGSGRLSCASCHSPARAYGPPNSAAVMLGGPHLRTPGVRTVPSLRYLYRQPAFSIGPDSTGDNDQVTSLAQQALKAAGQVKLLKTAAAPQAAAVNRVPQGGLFWDGRADTLEQQIDGPLYNPLEMDAGSPGRVIKRLETAPYARDFVRLFGPAIFQNPHLAADEAMFAIARYQIENPDFHPFTSKFDAWLAGKARFTPAQQRGYRLFNDPAKGNCAACHLDRPTRDGLPPLFTDFQYEALGAPRNAAIPANRDARYYDLGLCGPYRTDLRRETQYCGLFLTPSLRNVATRRVFFHNGVFHSLAQVLDFYVNRDLHPERFYARDAAGRVVPYDDLPARYRVNVDKADAPFDRRPGEQPALTDAQMRDMIAFLDTLTDGYRGTSR